MCSTAYTDTNNIPIVTTVFTNGRITFGLKSIRSTRLSQALWAMTHVIKAVYHNDNLTTLILANDVAFYFEHNCENQKLQSMKPKSDLLRL